jgi:hypothetical protein
MLITPCCLCKCCPYAYAMASCALQRDLLLLADSVLRSTTVELTPLVSVKWLGPWQQRMFKGSVEATPFSSCASADVCAVWRISGRQRSHYVNHAACRNWHTRILTCHPFCWLLVLCLQELTWLVGALVASKNMFDAERLLSSYVLTRRNALSSTAAVEHALIQVNKVVPAGA